MEMKELLEAIETIHQHFLTSNPHLDNEKQTLLRSLKLGEEVGELNEQIMGYYGHGRKEKIERYSPESLGHEIADVIFSTILVAKSLDVDIEKAMIEKMEKIKERLGIQ